MKKIIVTGALGHIGSQLIRDLPVAFPESEIIMIDNMMTQRYCSLFNLPEAGHYQFFEDDVTTLNLDPIFKGADVVIHLAAVVDSAASVDQKELVEKINLSSTVRVAQACLDVDIRMLHISTASVYGPKTDRIDESCGADELVPQSPYAAVKIKEELHIRALVKKHGLRACTFRFGTIFGASPGMRFQTAVNKFCWYAARGQPIQVWSTAYDQKRPYLDVGDASRAMIHALKKDLFDGNVYNIVTKNATVREVVDVIRQQISSVSVKFVDNKIMNSLSYSVLDDRIRATGYVPIGDLSKSLSHQIKMIKIPTF